MGWDRGAQALFKLWNLDDDSGKSDNCIECITMLHSNYLILLSNCIRFRSYSKLLTTSHYSTDSTNLWYWVSSPWFLMWSCGRVGELNIAHGDQSCSRTMICNTGIFGSQRASTVLNYLEGGLTCEFHCLKESNVCFGDCTKIKKQRHAQVCIVLFHAFRMFF